MTSEKQKEEYVLSDEDDDEAKNNFDCKGEGKKNRKIFLISIQRQRLVVFKL